MVSKRYLMSGQRGFSLLELLVVVLVIVLLTSVVNLNVGSGGADIARGDEVRQLAALLGYAQTEAEFSGSDYGLYLERLSTEDGREYVGHWLRRYDQGWSAPEGTGDVLEPFRFASGVDLSLSLTGAPDIEITDRGPDLRPSPQIVLFAGGETTEGAIDWIDSVTGAVLYRLRWDLFGRTTLMPAGREPVDELR